MIWFLMFMTALVKALWNIGWGSSEMGLLWAIVSWLLAEKVIEWSNERKKV